MWKIGMSGQLSDIAQDSKDICGYDDEAKMLRSLCVTVMLHLNEA